MSENAVAMKEDEGIVGTADYDIMDFCSELEQGDCAEDVDLLPRHPAKRNSGRIMRRRLSGAGVTTRTTRTE